MVPGSPVRITDGRFLFVPSLTIAELIRHADKLAAFNHFSAGGWLQANAETLDAVLDVIGIAVQKNHPDVRREDLPDLVDIRVAQASIAALLGHGEYMMPPEEEVSVETSKVKEQADRYLGLQLQGRVADA
jgi:hypothetical protein